MSEPTAPSTNGTGEAPPQETEHVVVPLSALTDFDAEPSARELRREYQLIQALKRIRQGRDPVGAFTDSIKVKKDASLDDVRDRYIAFMVQEHRPEKSYAEIAEIVGVTKKTLWIYRKKAGLID